MSVIERNEEKIARFFGDPVPKKESSVNLTFMIASDDLDGGFVASCKELPGVYAQGETADEAIKNMIDSVSAALAVKYEASRK